MTITFERGKPKRQGWNDDARYHTSRWQKVRARILIRDGYRCQITRGCGKRASIADHIERASLAMPDSHFFAEANLRAACVSCNLGRGNRERDTPIVVRPRNTYQGGQSFSGARYMRPPLAVSLSPGSRWEPITADYTRRPPERAGAVLGLPTASGRPLGRGMES